MHTRTGWVALVAAVALLAVGTGCVSTQAGLGTFDRTLSVNGPVRLELKNGSGAVRISAGQPGEVRIHAEFRVGAFLWDNVNDRIAELTKNPPIEQTGNVIRVGFRERLLQNIRIEYTIVVPPDTELHAGIGSGSLEARSLHGRVSLSAGSGSVAAEDIGDDAEVSAGSGSIHLGRVQGQVRFSVGSGSVLLEDVRGEIRGSTGSGKIALEQPGGRVTVSTGSGDVSVTGAASDVRITTGSGMISVEGNPVKASFWELTARSGRIELRVSSTASFRLYAHSSSGRIETDLPLLVEEQARRTLRARMGAGDARVEVQTSSGSIHIR